MDGSAGCSPVFGPRHAKASRHSELPYLLVSAKFVPVEGVASIAPRSSQHPNTPESNSLCYNLHCDNRNGGSAILEVNFTTMAFSPSPTSPITAPRSNVHLNRRSPTPPLQPLSKRDKRRQQHLAQQQDLRDEFHQNRDHHYRTQLIALQCDMNLITQADPYNPEDLDDSPEEIARLVGTAASGTPYQEDMALMAGRWYSEFIHEVNNAKEERDIELIQLTNAHNARLERLKYECDYRLHLAAEECEQMSATLRERLVQSLSHKRQRLMKEKEQLDIADTNTLLLHPSQFSITNPSSPGGGPTSRKTRYTRHRVDQEELGNGYGADGNGKRKRKIVDDDIGSPARNGNSTPAERVKATGLAHQTAPLYSIHNLFTDKELAFQSHQAQIATRHFFSTSHKDGESNGLGKRSRDSDADKSSGTGEESGQDDDEEVGAVDMDRTASQNVHVTRSTRTTGALAGLNILSDLAEKAATRPTLPYATLHSHQARANQFIPSPSRLMPEELDEDLIKMNQIALQPQGQVDKKDLEDALRPLSEGRSNIAPDWPLYMDIHLVNIDPQESAVRHGQTAGY